MSTDEVATAPGGLIASTPLGRPRAGPGLLDGAACGPVPIRSRGAARALPAGPHRSWRISRVLRRGRSRSAKRPLRSAHRSRRRRARAGEDLLRLLGRLGARFPEHARHDPELHGSSLGRSVHRRQLRKRLPTGHGGRCGSEQLRRSREHLGRHLQQDGHAAGGVHLQLFVEWGEHRDLVRHRQQRRPNRCLRPDGRSLVRGGLRLDEHRQRPVLRVCRRLQERRPGVGRMVALRHPDRRRHAQLAVRLSQRSASGRTAYT